MGENFSKYKLRQYYKNDVALGRKRSPGNLFPGSEKPWTLEYYSQVR